MTKTKGLLFTAGIVLAMAFTFSCSGDDSGGGGDSSSSGDGGDGTFTLTGIPSEYNGKYAVLVAEGRKMDEVYGAENISVQTNTFNLVQISGGSVKIPMWKVDGTPVRYYGNDNTNDNTIVAIFSKAAITMQELNPNNSSFIIGIAFSPVQFANGSATKAWSDGEVINGSGDD